MDEQQKLKFYTHHNLSEIRQLSSFPEIKHVIHITSLVLPFRVNSYVVNELIDWNNVPNDPLFKICFPQPEMLASEDFRRLEILLSKEAPKEKIQKEVDRIRASLNPHPADQLSLNVPLWKGKKLEGMQHKYAETLLFFPKHGQYCHSYCTFCFRWAQFIGDKSLLFASQEVEDLCDYLKGHQEITDILFTGGDPFVMPTKILRNYIDPLLEAKGLEHIQTIRIGTKALTYFPHRFLSSEDGDDLMRLLERIVAKGKHLAVMAHFNHPRELEAPATQKAIRRLQSAGAIIRCQAPVLRHINDDADIWAELWKRQINLGMIPYYMFVERDTGPKDYFQVSLARVLEIYQGAISQLSGLGRSVQGPVMSASPGKIKIEGTLEMGGEKCFVLKFLQAREKQWLHRLFFAQYSAVATWFDQLQPRRLDPYFFFEPEFQNLKNHISSPLATTPTHELKGWRTSLSFTGVKS